jgi:HEPN domain-containing protein
LCSYASKFEVEFSEKVKRCALLDSYYVPTRYPNCLPDGIWYTSRVYTSDAAKEAVKLTEEIVNFVEGS